MPNKIPVALKDYARKGPIGFQGLHGKAMAPVYENQAALIRIERA
jgi:hypothetical protein